MLKAHVGWIALIMVAGLAAASDDPGYALRPKGTLTFDKDIAPIVYKNCTGCHRAGEVAPFALQTFQDVSKRAKQIARVTQSRYMPPWKAEPGHGDFMDERRLSSEQVGMFQQWVDEGTAEGDSADLPPAPKFPDGWKLGEPDLVLKMSEAYTVPAEGRDVFRCFVLPINNDDEKYVTAVEFRPGNRKVVHHALFFLDANGSARKKLGQDKAPGYASFGSPGIIPTGGLGGWAPGYTPRPLPDGMGRVIKKGSDLVIQVHFHPSGKEEQEQSTIGLYFAKKKPEKFIASINIANRNIDIVPGDKSYKVTKDFVTPIDAEVVGITPHAHYLCKDMKVNATLPDGTVQSLIWIKDWDFSWQDQYLYKNPVKLPKGTKVAFEYTYDNSAENPRNPSNPPKEVKFGQQTEDEMALVFLSYVTQNPDDAAKLRRQMIIDRLRGALGGDK